MLLQEALKRYEKDLIDEKVSILDLGTVNVLCLKIPGGLLRAFDRNHPEPLVPIKEVKVLGGGTSLEPDPTDRAYKAESDTFENERAMDFMTLSMDFIFVLDADEREQRERNDYMARYGFACSELDRIDCFLLADDMEENIRLACEELMRLSAATAKEVRKQEEGFRPEVDGDVSDEAGDAEEQSVHSSEQEDVSVP